MHAMLLDSDIPRLDRLQIAFLEAGIHVTGSGSLSVAECCLRRAVADVLLVDLDTAGAYLPEIVTLAERRNPRLVTLFLSDAVSAATDRWSDRFASLHCVLEGVSEAGLVARMARASLAGRARCSEVAQKAAAEVRAAADQNARHRAEAARSPVATPQAAVPPQPAATTQHDMPHAVQEARHDPSVAAREAHLKQQTAAMRTTLSAPPRPDALSAQRSAAPSEDLQRTAPPVGPALKPNEYPAIRMHPALAAQRAAEAQTRTAAADKAPQEQAPKPAAQPALASIQPLRAQTAAAAVQPLRPQTAPTPAPAHAPAQAPVAAPEETPRPVFQTSRRRLGVTSGALMSA
ncbi:hypothetical protein [Sagittula stellata]|uniref:Uncharacterized protein n=1 Tax=Sagittula stellata (strain ATCC 700073 / DSM 11524 / E-37) TaxID=388399 RepID=A3JZN6_SAGS3|nr:hypothetical protein [Sagittula stellata]EBA09939.1 hypothetical protein SSE37_09023 [Sagittula stellata E-37]